MSDLTLFVDVVVPVAIPNTLTYRVPRGVNDSVGFGQRVIVRVGKTRLHTAVIKRVHSEPPLGYTAKYIELLLDEVPIITSAQMSHWEWMASYYMCTLGEVLGMALPAGLKLAAESKLVAAIALQEVDQEQVSDNEYLVLEALELRSELTIAEVAEILGIKTIQPLIKSLLDKGFVMTVDEVQERYKPKIETRVRLHADFRSDNDLHQLLDRLGQRAPKQLDLVMALLHIDPSRCEGVSRVALQKKAQCTSSVTKALVEQGVLQLDQVEVDRINHARHSLTPLKPLSRAQAQAYDEIKSGFQKHAVVLLHGVTGSGKTEVYVKLIKETLDRGEQVLFLLPEIALTTQLINRLQNYFGSDVGVYHSRFNQQERAETWMRVLKTGDNQYPIVIGARSALFLPFAKLGLIIVDEEHEPSFKQYDPAPRYNGRDAAIVLAHAHKAKVLLGSATPSIESYANCHNNRYGLVTINERFGDAVMPDVVCADIRRELKRKTMREEFTSLLIEEMEQTIRAGKQVILFQNRRGYAPLWQCKECGWVPECTRCDVSLTYHKVHHHLNCHYCGYTEQPPTACKSCGSHDLRSLGFGTEKIEEDLAELLPGARIARMDFDTTRSKNAYSQLLQKFDRQEIDILVGTQMVTKGLDFEHVGLVGVLNADMLLRFPDFRSYERAFQLMVQVSGRAGRKNERGKVVIQTYDPEHWVLKMVIEHDFEGLYRHEVLERQKFAYPPFTRLIRLSLRHKNSAFLRESAHLFANSLRQKLGHQRVVGPEAPYVTRIRNLYYQEVLIKLEREGSPTKFKQAIEDVMAEFRADKNQRSIRIVADVDPA
jgi:primosomal protein N' (replication factor Y)